MKNKTEICPERKATFDYLSAKHRALLVESRELIGYINEVHRREEQMAFSGWVEKSKEFHLALRLLWDEQSVLNEKITAVRNTIQLLHSDFASLTTSALVYTNPTSTSVDFLPSWFEASLGRN
ncbi:hypothetical protein [Vibrio owensii]|uniref:hypothetical protein n=1 Tax=Vibrio owensii TaxID=696485 RepID=UPI0018F1F454|nr:hypothetical protein [Vibrio owensii]